MLNFTLPRGFLPAEDPITQTPNNPAWDATVTLLPKLLVAGKVRQAVHQLPAFNYAGLESRAQWERAMVVCSYLGQAYVLGEGELADRLPAVLAQPWVRVAKQVGRPPIMEYATQALNNWRRLDPNGPIETANLVLNCNYLGGQDEEWFVLIHVEIESKASAAVSALPLALAAAKAGDAGALATHFGTVIAALQAMMMTLSRMPERCDPYIYYNRVRPFMFGWKNNPALPNGMIYEGVAEFGGQPQQFLGETGAQSSVIYAIDAMLGVRHEKDSFRAYLDELFDYMPPTHRQFIRVLEANSTVREYVAEHVQTHPALRDAYNACVTQIAQFRIKHMEYAAMYIANQAQKNAANSTEIGTGGTPFMRYLGKHRDATRQHLL